MRTQISIIIPCYNSEVTLENTLKSVIDQDYQDWEVIIVNDGSIDTTEEIALKWVDLDTRFRYFSKENEGLGKARNYGIERAKGIYILPLDSDNLIEKDFVVKAIEVLDSKKEIGVVHGHAKYFGEKVGFWKVDEFNLSKILVHNYIDACAIYRKNLWKKVGGYDENLPFQGHEDWDFWIGLGRLNVNFHHLNRVTFSYFVSSNSMIKSFTNEMILLNQDYIVKKYQRLFHERYSILSMINRQYYSQLAQNTTSKKLIKIILRRIKQRLWK